MNKSLYYHKKIEVKNTNHLFIYKGQWNQQNLQVI